MKRSGSRPKRNGRRKPKSAARKEAEEAAAEGSGRGTEGRRRQAVADEARASQAAAAAASTPIVTDENVQFTVFRRSAIQPEHWYPLLCFAHLAERRPDATDEFDPIEEVQAQARQILGEDIGEFRSATEDSGYPVAREGELRFVPRMDGVAFNPPERRFLWTESVHREDFRMRADKSMDGRVARGAVSVFYGSLLLAEVQLSIKVDRKVAESRHEETHARPYRRIFASYSHRDTAIVEEFESHVVATGDRYLRDVVTLRAGEVWDERLLESIKEADVFQLFWSWNALSSNLVREEWRQALALNRPHFVRPVVLGGAAAGAGRSSAFRAQTASLSARVSESSVGALAIDVAIASAGAAPGAVACFGIPVHSLRVGGGCSGCGSWTLLDGAERSTCCWSIHVPGADGTVTRD